MNTSPTSISPWPHRLAVSLAFGTLSLIFIGGLVTSTHSGLAVPDWPLSYGRLMPPMVGGILFEHGHRMVASAIGFITVVMAIVFTLKETRRWVKAAAWAAVGLVVLQGVLGGLTVLFLLPKAVSIAHACMAQTFLCLTTALAVWSSPAWQNAKRAPASSTKEYPLHQLGAALFVACYVQLFLGALLRHTGIGLVFHIVGALFVEGLVFWIFGRVLLTANPPRGLWGTAWALLSVTLTQVVLGFTSYVFLSGRSASQALSVTVVTAHVMTGALLLALCAFFALWSWRVRPLDENERKSSAPPQRISDYFTLTKPGISLMTGVTALAGYLLGSAGKMRWDLLIHTVIGTLLVSAGACALNMLLEIDVDSQMRRTRGRPLPSGRLKPGEALLFGSLLAVTGIVYLAATVNLLTAFLAGATLSVYLYLYTPLKKVSAVCITVGAVAGALPPVMGWTAATGHLGIEALSLFSILFFWQFPHFFALAWMYREDYANAGLMMLPDMAPDGEGTARKAVMNSFALLAASLLPTFLGLTGMVYAGVAMVLGAGVLVMSWLFFRERSMKRARGLFFASIIYMPVLVVFMVLGRVAA